MQGEEVFMGEKYIYAVARIRVLEGSLLSNAVIRQLMACQTYDQCLSFLKEKGWGDDGTGNDAEAMLSKEEARTWQVVKELAVSPEKFEVIRCQKRFHNLKAAVREVCTEEKDRTIFYEGTDPSGEEMERIIRERDYDRLPKDMRDVARDSIQTLLHTGDAQSADLLIDRAALKRIRDIGETADEEIIRVYAETAVAVSDIRIAVRAQRMKKPPEFMERAMVECRSVQIKRLARAAAKGAEEIANYLRETPYAGGAEALGQSMSAFERWCDNRMIRMISLQKYEPFGIGPVVAYVIARQNEIRTVRIILTGKYHHLPEERIWERVREMYV